MKTKGSPEDESDAESEGTYSDEGSARHQSYASRRPEQTSRKPGKFHALQDFITFDDDSPLHRTSYRLAHELDLQPGHIFHVGDSTSSRIDKRVMLMIKAHCHSNITCIAFCAHTDESDFVPGIHRQAQQYTADPNRVEVHQHGLRRQTHEGIVELSLPRASRLSEGITVNIHEMWNVEREVQVKVLGRVSNWPNVRAQVLDAFASDLLQTQVHGVEDMIQASSVTQDEYHTVPAVQESAVNRVSSRHKASSTENKPPERQRSQGKRPEKRYWKTRDGSERHHVGLRRLN